MTLDQQINTAIAIGTWFAGTATFFAVYVSLYLAKQISTPKAKISIGHRIMVVPGVPGPYKEFIVFHVVNSGDRNLKVTQIGWKVGFLKKRYAIQLYDESESSPLPIELAHGQEARWFTPLNNFTESWLINFAKDMMMPTFRISCFTIKGQIFSSLGHVFEKKPEPNVIQKLKEAYNQNLKTNNTLKNDLA